MKLMSPLPLAVIKPITVTSCVLLSTSFHANSQNAPGLPAELLGNRAAPEAAVRVDESPENSNSSRFVSPENLTDYVSSASSKFDILTRKTDPFGQVQDPNAEAPVVKAVTPTRRYPSMKPTAFKDIVSRIRINTIMPAEGRFLSNNRSFKLGSKFPIEFRGRQTQVQIVAVTGSRVDFKNLDSGEVASVKVKLLPAGMQPGASGITAPGMVLDKPDAPLRIDPTSDF